MVEIDANIAGGIDGDLATRKKSLGPLKNTKRSQSITVVHKKHSISGGRATTMKDAKITRKLSSISTMQELDHSSSDKFFFGDDTAAVVHFHNPLLLHTKPNNHSVSLSDSLIQRQCSLNPIRILWIILVEI